ncbi:SDR family NAD(P)-dependent oxidoreductase [Microbacterium sp. NPDC055683]
MRSPRGPRRAVVARFDATALDDAPGAIDAIADELDGIDVFVNNARGGGGTAFLDQSLDEWRSTMALDLDGAFAGMQAAARRMAADDGAGAGRPRHHGERRGAGRDRDASRLPRGGVRDGCDWAVDGGVLQMGPRAGSHLDTDAWREG